MSTQDPANELARIATALENLAHAGHQPKRGVEQSSASLDAADAFVWQAGSDTLKAIDAVQHVPLELLKGIDLARDILVDNTRQFARGFSANNALLWGARGMGKSTLVKAVHAAINTEFPRALVLIEIHREDIARLYHLLNRLRETPRRAILMCDDLSFEANDSTLKSLKALLEGGLEGRPPNVLFYATSNRRHLTPRDIMENERSTAIHPAEVVEEKVSLSDRFGLWLGFHGCNQETYLEMIDGYAAHRALEIDREDLHGRAIEWQATRGARSGRVAWQFIQDLEGRMAMSHPGTISPRRGD